MPDHSFGYNRKEQLKHILALPFAALLTAWVCTLFCLRRQILEGSKLENKSLKYNPGP